ncbi:hypothetical protein Pth03_00020 [Planotetraspora thailandica]|uniref:Replicase polyprotein 1ab n=1 Tax=Planotetraspora thailandica TaxID=487172 RepID=A0A8J3UT64_9ACTN|nr:hypothetical protein [Planotetraspora thailandica]GII51613.1 hypothetical protein Pth03_00020 [Planotetraspora thailandica]
MASHLVAAARALSEDEPERAYEHAKVARRFAGRIGVVREATGIAAYRAGQYAEALADLRAARRMTGSDAYLPIMADCERGLGRPERALDLVRSPEAERLDREGRIELAIVESGARRDMNQFDAAVVTLQRVPELRDPQPRPWSARLAFAYADALAAAGHEAAAVEWFERAMTFDEDGETDAAERYAELTGAVIEDIEEDFDDEADLDEDDFGDEAADEAVADLSAKPADDSADSDEAEDDSDDEPDDDDEDDEDDDDDEDDEDDKDGDILDARATDDDAVNSGEQTPVAVTNRKAGEPESDQTPENGKAGESKDAAAAGEKNEVPTFGPAFIEPDFGDRPADVDEEDDDRRQP